MGNAERERADQQRQLEQEFPALAPVTLASPSRDESEGGPAVPGILLKAREDGGKRSESPMVARPVSLGRRDSANIPTPKIKQAVKLIDENAGFCDSISEFMTDNQDFLVIGVCGLQNVGKSTLMNALARVNPTAEGEEVFRVQNFEHQMLAEHCTNGVDVFVTNRRIILLDCQPLLSASVMDRTIQLEKKYSSEFSSTENTVEVHSLQQLGFLLSVCHSLLLVQDWATDMNLIRLLLAAEMLKPLSPSMGGDERGVTEHFPHLVIVQNKAEFTDMEPSRTLQLEEFYSTLLSKSQLQWNGNGSKAAGARDSGLKPHLVYVTDMEGEREEVLSKRHSPDKSYEECLRELRRKVFGLEKGNLTTAKLSEKGWVSLASKTWDAIRNSPFYMEYSRLLP